MMVAAIASCEVEKSDPKIGNWNRRSRKLIPDAQPNLLDTGLDIEWGLMSTTLRICHGPGLYVERGR